MKNKKEKMKYQLRMAQGAYKKSAPILTLLCDRSENNGLSFVVGVVSIWLVLPKPTRYSLLHILSFSV